MKTRRLLAALPAALLCILPPGAPSSARADDDAAKTNDDDPAVNASGMAVNRILQILRSDPNAASDSCINALKQMHKTQEAVDNVEKGDQNDQDLVVARDVLSSTMEDVATICGADARTLCRGEKAGQPKVAASCATFLHDEGEE